VYKCVTVVCYYNTITFPTVKESDTSVYTSAWLNNVPVIHINIFRISNLIVTSNKFNNMLFREPLFNLVKLLQQNKSYKQVIISL